MLPDSSCHMYNICWNHAIATSSETMQHVILQTVISYVLQQFEYDFSNFYGTSSVGFSALNF